MKRDVTAELDIDVTARTTLELQIAVAPHAGADVTEPLSFVLDGNKLQPREVIGMHSNRIHKFDAQFGNPP